MKQSKEHTRTLEVTCVALCARVKSVEQQHHIQKTRAEDLEVKLFESRSQVAQLGFGLESQRADALCTSKLSQELADACEQIKNLRQIVLVWQRKHAAVGERATELVKDRDALAFSSMKAEESVAHAAAAL